VVPQEPLNNTAHTHTERLPDQHPTSNTPTIMADVLSPPATSPAPIPYTNSPETMDASSFMPRYTPAPAPLERERLPSFNRSRMSIQSQHTSRSRPQSSVFPAFHSSLQYAMVRDFAYPVFHPMHYGPPPDPPSGATTPGSEWSQSRRLSDPSDNTWSSSSRTGPWGGDGYLYPDSQIEALPSTSFGEESGDIDHLDLRSSQHRRSRSYNTIADWERGRRRESSGRDGESMFHFTSSSQLDPAGSSSLRHSRGFHKRDSHFAATLTSRAFHTSEQQDAPRRRTGEDEDVIPLDSENSTHAQSPQRASMGPEDELFAGESLALYAFEPLNPNELRLREGQIIMVSYRHGQGWLVAEDPTTGEQGLVPEEYVRLVRNIETWDPERGTFVDENGDVIGLDAEDGEVELVDESTQSSFPPPESDDINSGNSSEAITDRPSKAMLVEPPDVDHNDEGLQMSSPLTRKRAEWRADGVEDERRQDSGHAEK
jgi:hypothetical protein